MKKYYLGYVLMLVLVVCYISIGIANPSNVTIEEPETVDAVSSATGKISNWMEFYPTYGIFVVFLPQEDGYQWSIVSDENSMEAIKVLNSGVANHIWYAGMEATTPEAVIRIRFRLTKDNKEVESRYVDLRIQDSRITKITDYGKEKRAGFIIAGER